MAGVVLPREQLEPNHRRDLRVRPFTFDKLNPVSFDCFLEDADGDHVVVPRFWARDVLGIPLAPGGGMAAAQQSPWTFKGTLRPHQKEVIDQVSPSFDPAARCGGGIISVPCGFGKTCMAIYLITVLRLKTLIVVHKSQLMQQWQESISRFTDLHVGRIQQKIVDAGPDRPVVMGMLQSLASRDYDQSILNSFDFLIVDEVHNVATKVFSRLLFRVAPPYTLGLSATPQRVDGTSKVFHWFLGPMLYRLSAKAAAAAAAATEVDAPAVVVKQYMFRSPKIRDIVGQRGNLLLSLMLNTLVAVPERTTLIAQIIRDIIDKDAGRCVLVLSSRIQQLEDLHRILRDQHPLTSLYIGSMKPSQLKEATETAQILLATYEMANEGFDLPRLNTLVLATPRSRIEQAVGRILRKKDPRHPPLVIDIVDRAKAFEKQGIKRSAFYKSLGYSVETL